jgi:class 3 adenylate cyclase/CHASE2 domain-containing sensor protein
MSENPSASPRGDSEKDRETSSDNTPLPLPAANGAPEPDSALSTQTREAETMAQSAPGEYEAPDEGAESRARRRRRVAEARLNFALYLRARRTELMAVVIALTVANFFILQVKNFEGRYDKAREISWWLPFWESLENAELGLFDARLTARGPRVPNCLNKIAIVGIDDKAMTVLGQWPFPRKYHAQLVRRLKKAGAKVIVLDFDFSNTQEIESDMALAKAMAEAGNVLLPSFDSYQYNDVVNVKTSTNFNAFTSPLSASSYDQRFITYPEEFRGQPQKIRAYQQFKELGLDEQTPDLAVATLPKDSDDASRRYPFRSTYNEGSVQVGGLSVLAAAQFQDLLDGRENQAYELALKSGLWPAQHGAAVKVPLRINPPAISTAPTVFTTPINFWGPPGTFATESYHDVAGYKTVNAKGEAETGGYDEKTMKQKFGGRIVFVGAYSHILKDDFPVPYFDRNILGEKIITDSRINGVEIHATVTAMLLDGAYIRTAGQTTTMALVYLLTVALSLWTAILRGWVNKLASKAQARASKVGLRLNLHALFWFGLFLPLVLLPIIGFWEGAKWLFEFQNLWVIAVYPMASALIASGSVLIMLFAGESIERRKVIEQLGSHFSPAVRDEILAQPEGQFVRPRRVVATMLFTDLEGFTSYSETHEPEQVVEALNSYFDRMVPIVKAHGGEMDKYIGDAIMAFFGLPIPRYDHAAQALLCAIAMQEECARFREETGIEFYMRIGIHTGELIAGSIGAQKAKPISYTTIGDTVNLASRLEGKNKEFGSWIMCSAETFALSQGMVEAVTAQTSIKGKAQNVEVFIVRGLSGKPEQWEHWGRLDAVKSGESLPHGAQPDGPMALGSQVRALPAPADDEYQGKAL